MKVRCTQRCVQCIKYGVVCVFLICFAAFLPAQETDAAQNASVPENRWFQITNVQYDIKGMTKQYPLSRAVPIDTVRIFHSHESLQNYIAQLEQRFKNIRTIASVHIHAEYDESGNADPIPVTLHIAVTDTWNFIAIPYPSFDSNTGFQMKLKMQDFNFVGTLQPLKTDIVYRATENNQHIFSSSVNFALPFKAGIFDMLWQSSFEILYAYKTVPKLTIASGLETAYRINSRVSLIFGLTPELIINDRSATQAVSPAPNRHPPRADSEKNPSDPASPSTPATRETSPTPQVPTPSTPSAPGTPSTPGSSPSTPQTAGSSETSGSSSSASGSTGTSGGAATPGLSATPSVPGASPAPQTPAPGTPSTPGASPDPGAVPFTPEQSGFPPSQTAPDDDDHQPDSQDGEPKKTKTDPLGYVYPHDRYYFRTTFYVRAPVVVATVKNIGSLVWTPSMHLSGNWAFDGIQANNLKNWTFGWGHSLSFARVNWIENFRRGFSLSLGNTYAYKFYHDKQMRIGFTASATGYYPFINRVGIYGRTQFFYYLFKETSTQAGAALRGILNKRIDTDTAFTFNLDIPIRIVSLDFQEITGVAWTRFLNCDIQLTPFLDIAFVHDKKTGRYYHPADGWYAGGLEMIVYPQRMRSIYVRASVGFDLAELKNVPGFNKIGGRAKRDGEPISEIFIGIGVHY